MKLSMPKKKTYERGGSPNEFREPKKIDGEGAGGGGGGRDHDFFSTFPNLFPFAIIFFSLLPNFFSISLVSVKMLNYKVC